MSENKKIILVATIILIMDIVTTQIPHVIEVFGMINEEDAHIQVHLLLDAIITLIVDKIIIQILLIIM